MGGSATSPSWRPRARTQPRPQPGSSHWRSTSRFTWQPVRVGAAAHPCQSPRGHSQSPWFDGAQLESRRSAAGVLEVVRFFAFELLSSVPFSQWFLAIGGRSSLRPVPRGRVYDEARGSRAPGPGSQACDRRRRDTTGHDGTRRDTTGHDGTRRDGRRGYPIFSKKYIDGLPLEIDTHRHFRTSNKNQ